MDDLVGRVGNDRLTLVTLAWNIIASAIVDKIKKLRATDAEYAVLSLTALRTIKTFISI